MAEPTLARRLVPLSLMFIAVGLATSFVGPYLALFLTDAVHAGPVRTTAFLIVAPLSGVLVSSLIGRVSDRRPIRRQLLILASVAGLAGAALTAVSRDYWVVLAVTVTLTAISGSLFPQSFAYARQILQRRDPARAAFGISTLRTLFSAAWVGGPPLAALVLAAHGFTWTYGLAALMYAAAVLLIIVGLPTVPPPVVAHAEVTAPEPTHGRLAIWVIVAGIGVTQTASTLNVQAMSLFVSTDLGGTIRDAGLILGLCAALEIPLMLAFGALSTRVPLRRLILLGAGCAIAYQAVAASAHAVWVLAAAQVLQAVVIATVGALSIPYVQDMMPAHPGRATTMVTNTFPAGQILAAPLFGLAQHFGFRLAYGINLGLAVIGLVMLLASAGLRPRVPAEPEPAVL